MPIGVMNQPALNQPRYKWYQQRKHVRIPKKAESKRWIDKKYTKVDFFQAPTSSGGLPLWVFTNNTGPKTYATAGGFLGPIDTYSLISPPTGFTINPTSGVITADSSITAAGTPTLTIQASNAYGFATQTLATAIAIAAPQAVGSLGTWTEVQNTGNKTFASAVGFSGASITYTLISPPTGYTIVGATGVVTCNTATAGIGTRNITVRATNVSGSADQVISSVIASGLVAPAAVGTIGPWNVTQFTGSLTFNAATGFTGASITYTLQTGATGVSINGTTGLVTADTSATGSGTKALVVRATNGSGFADQPLSLVITALAAPIAVGTLGPWNETQNTGSKTFNAAGGFSGSLITYSLVTPPVGVTINGSTGVVTADTGVLSIGTTALTVRADNGAGGVNQALSFVLAIASRLSGGIRTDVTIGGLPYVVHTFNASGNIDVLVEGRYDLLYCAAGGAGGASPGTATAGGGGGGGGFLIRSNVLLTASTYPIVIGAPGVGVNSASTARGGTGGDLVAFGTTIKGGGGGGTGNTSAPDNIGGIGGSGGGGAARASANVAGGVGTSGQGFAGGSSWGAPTGPERASGGGGGAGGAGGNAIINKGGAGGIGVTTDFDGISTIYAPGASGTCCTGGAGTPGTPAPGGATGADIAGSGFGVAGTAPGAGGPGVRTAGTSLTANPGVFKIRYAVSVAPVLISPGTISGTAMVGSVLSVNGEAYTGENAVATYQWTRNGVNIVGATGAAYVLRVADIGAAIARRTIVTNASGSNSGSTPATAAIAKFESEVTFSTIEQSSVTVTGGTQITTNVGGSARANRYLLTGKTYFEVAFPGGTVVDATAYVGLSDFDSDVTPSAVAAQDLDITSVMLNGGVRAPSGWGAGAALTANRATGDVIRVAVNMDNHKVWFGTNAGWSGDPAAGTGGFTLPNFTRLTAHVYPRSASGANFTLRSKSSTFTQPIPTGYTPYAEMEAVHEGSTASAADKLADSIGINLQLNRQSEFWGGDTWKQPLYDLGIRYVRTGLGTGGGINDANEIYAAAGIKCLVRLALNKSPPSSYNNAEILDFYNAAVTDLGVNKIIGFEGPNEPNLENTAGNGWDTRSKAAQTYVASLVNGSPATNGIPVIAIATWYRCIQAQTLLGSFSGIADVANLHHYMDGSRPTYAHRLPNVGQATTAANLVNTDLSTLVDSVKSFTPGGRMWVTETGCRCYDPGYSGPAAFDPDQATAAKYIIRLLFEFFDLGVERTFHFELADAIDVGGEEYGLLQNRTGPPPAIMVKRPSYFSVQRLIPIFNDPGPNSPVALPYSLTGNLSDVHHHLFQKVNGTYLLAIWHDAETWNRLAPGVTIFPAPSIKVALGRKALQVRKFLPTTTAAITMVATDVYEFTVSIPDEVAIFEITTVAAPVTKFDSTAVTCDSTVLTFDEEEV